MPAAVLPLTYRHRVAVNIAAKLMREGAVIAYPTEAVWGLGCDPHNRTAIARLLQIKGRSADKGLIQVAASIEQFQPALNGLDEHLLARLDNSWPGPVTWLVPDNGSAEQLVRGHFSAVALRVSAHPLVAALCDAFGGPIVSTSANFSGDQAPRWPWQVRRQLGPQLDFLVGGSVGASRKPSQIRDLISGAIIRAS
ncbi:MAG: L-threonylcarbamoyladenylate synthase [Paraglaciecola psychrophila]|jgi:L-threonylcarbamoyladenylate synthase